MSQQDMRKLTDGLRDTLVGEFRRVLEGAESDIIAYGDRIATDLALAVSVGRQDLIDEIKDQALLLAEKQRLRAKNANANATLIVGLITTAIQAAAGGAQAGIKSSS